MTVHNSYTNWSLPKKTTVTVTERVFDEHGNIVKETVTVTETQSGGYNDQIRPWNPYPYIATYGDSQVLSHIN